MERVVVVVRGGGLGGLVVLQRVWSCVACVQCVESAACAVVCNRVA